MSYQPKLRKSQDFGELISKAIFVMLVPSIFVGLPPLVVYVKTASLSSGIGLFFLLYINIILWWNGIPPLQSPPPYLSIPITYNLLSAFFLIFFLNPKSPWFTGIPLSLGYVGISIITLIAIASKNFKQLKEIQSLGSSILQKLNTNPLVSHITDIHVTAGLHIPTIEGRHGGQKSMQKWAALTNSWKPKLILMSGDTTDTGGPLEWERFEGILHQVIPTAIPPIFSPGNHDLSKQYGNPADNKLLLYLACQARWCPNLLTPQNVKLGDLFSYAKQEIASLVSIRAKQMRQEFIEMRGALRTEIPGEIDFDHPMVFDQRIELANKTDWEAQAREALLEDWFNSQWYELFPLRLVEHKEGLLVLVLNGVLKSAETIGDSALGKLEEAQIGRLATILDELPDFIKHVFILTHHAPFRQPGDWQFLFLKWIFQPLSWRKAINRIKEFAFLAHEAKEARVFLDMISNAADKHQTVNFFLLCGHRHSPAAGRAGRVVILEGSSLAEKAPATWLIFTMEDSVFVQAESLENNANGLSIKNAWS